jgi:hypothetical protein
LKSDVDRIIYQNGFVDVFKREKSLSPEPIPDNKAKKDTIDLSSQMKTQYPDLYKKYKGGVNMRNIGNGCIGLGVGSTILGVAAIIAGSGKDGSKGLLSMGYISLGASGAFFATGFPLSCVGKRNKNRALDEFRQQNQSTSSASPQLRFGLGAHGIGLSYMFGGR